MTRRQRAMLALIAGLSLAMAGVAQQSDDAAESGDAAQEAAPEAPTEADVQAAEDAAVEEVLSDAELIYEEDEDSEDFIPSQQVSADQSLDYPIDI